MWLNFIRLVRIPFVTGFLRPPFSYVNYVGVVFWQDGMGMARGDFW
jgi:hypothetical protein